MASEPLMAHPTRTFTQVPITALCFYRSASGDAFLLAGEDNQLVVYDVRSRAVVGRCLVFDEQPVHGVSVQGHQALVWGAREVVWLSLQELVAGGEAVGLVRGRALDWIYDGAISPDDASSAVLATAHNEAIRVHLTPTGLSFSSPISPSRPILYAASLLWLTDDAVLFVGGTVFGEIFVWKCHLSDRLHEMQSVLVGHEGSIFGVHVSDEILLESGEKARLLASCSDDRTIRIWDITERGVRNQDDAQHQNFSAARETGFTVEDEDFVRDEKSQAIAVAMGHASRIWGVKFALPEEGASKGVPITVFSFGEDSTMQRWQLDIDVAWWKDGATDSSVELGTLKHQETFSLHEGKHLWSHALWQQGTHTQVATGGADGRISLISNMLPSADVDATRPAYGRLCLDFPTALATIPHPKQLSGKRELFGRYDFIAADQILAATSLGRILVGTLDQALTWREVDTEDSMADDLKRLYITTRVGHGMVVMGTTTGNLYLYSQESGVSRMGTVPGKIINIFNLSPNNTSDGSSFEVFINLHGTSDAYIFTLNSATKTVDRTDVTSLDDRFVTTASSRLDGGMLAIGSRHGYLTLLQADETGYRSLLAASTTSHDAITKIIPLPSNSATPSPYILTTNRDGHYRIYEIKDIEQRPSLHLRHESSPPLGPMIEGAWFTQSPTPELILYGFRGQDFVVWNETRREELAKTACGGANRNFALIHHPIDPYNLCFVFTKASRLYIYPQRGPSHQPLKTGIHGREVRSLCSNGRLIATGAEDTSIRIWEFREAQVPGNRELSCLAYMKHHVSGIQQLKWLGEDYLFSSAGYEEFFIWRVRRLNAAYAGLGIVCEAAFDDRSSEGDLRIMDFDVCKTASGDNLLITMALSNSTLKTYRYARHQGFRLLGQMSYTGACLTQIRHLGADENGVSVLAASTDGHLATWELQMDRDKVQNHVLVQVAPVHQNSIKSLALQATCDGYLVLTGGDDNALAVTSVVPFPDHVGTRRYTVSSRAIVRRAHAAAINSVILRAQGGRTLAVSVSNDQRVKVWNAGRDRIELVADKYSSVADIGDVEFLSDGDARVMVGGVGLEVWTL